MIALPEKLIQAFNAHMVKSGVSAHLQSHYRKWLWFYVDFCHKYRLPYSDAANLRPFLQKLWTKGNRKKLRVQNQDAVERYHRMLKTKGKEQGENVIFCCSAGGGANWHHWILE
jgi:hypothetical protein